MGTATKRYQTQWAAQFFAAAELSRRGYLVSLTLGNAPAVDLVVVSPNQRQFMVDVKGLASRNFWFVRERPAPPPDLFYIFVQVPAPTLPPRFFVLSCDDLIKEMKTAKEETLAQGGKWAGAEGIFWKSALAYEDSWDALPK